MANLPEKVVCIDSPSRNQIDPRIKCKIPMRGEVFTPFNIVTQDFGGFKVTFYEFKEYGPGYLFASEMFAPIDYSKNAAKDLVANFRPIRETLDQPMREIIKNN